MGTKASLQWSLERMEGEEGEKASADNSLLSLLTYVRLSLALLIEGKNYNSKFAEVQPKEIISNLCPGSHNSKACAPNHYIRSSPSIFSVATGRKMPFAISKPPSQALETLRIAIREAKRDPASMN